MLSFSRAPHRAERTLDRVIGSARRAPCERRGWDAESMETLVAAIPILERVQRDYPATRAGQDAKRWIVLYGGFRDAELKHDRRKAKDDLWALARALYDHQDRWKLYPESLKGLDRHDSLPAMDP